MVDPTLITLSGALPKTDEHNGLVRQAQRVVGDEAVKIVAVVVLDCAFIKHSVDSGIDVPQLRVRRVEPIVDEDDLRALGKIADRAHEARTGITRLAVDFGDDLADVFGPAGGSVVDMTTGEIVDTPAPKKPRPRTPRRRL